MTGLRLRPLRAEDEAAFRAGHVAMAVDGFTFGLGYDPDASWTAYLEELERQRQGRDLPDGLVPATFLVAVVGGALVGRVSIRHHLNEFLAREGGHIGYGVLAEARRRGFATEMLRQGLVIARSLGVDRVLVTCDEVNIGSATVIERCGGELETHVVSSDGTLMRRYWIA